MTRASGPPFGDLPAETRIGPAEREAARLRVAIKRRARLAVADRLGFMPKWTIIR